MSRGQFDRHRRVSPFITAVVAIVLGLVVVVSVVLILHPAVAK
jgi:hypothetical protein